MANPPRKPDPTKGPEFQKVVSHFLKTPPKPHNEGKGGASNEKRRPATRRKSRGSSPKREA